MSVYLSVILCNAISLTFSRHQHGTRSYVGQLHAQLNLLQAFATADVALAASAATTMTSSLATTGSAMTSSFGSGSTTVSMASTGSVEAATTTATTTTAIVKVSRDTAKSAMVIDIDDTEYACWC